MKKTYIIAEMAWSHNGILKNALKILNGAKKAGADAIGIHLTDLESYMTKDYKCLAGQTLSNSADNNVNIYNYLEKINLSNNEWEIFCKSARELEIDIIAMCNDINSFNFSKSLPITRYVISAASFHEYELLKSIVLYKNNLILRIGGATLDEIDNIIKSIKKINEQTEINILAGIQLYPTPVDQLHLFSIQALKEKYKDDKISFGLADHIDGDNPYAIYLPSLALAFNIDIIEKHITTDRMEKLEDYEAALGISQFKDFVDYIRICENALGNGILDYLYNDSYKKYREVSRKKIVALNNLQSGDIIIYKNITYKRSDFGEPLENLELILGRTLKVDISKDQGINNEDLK